MFDNIVFLRKVTLFYSPKSKFTALVVYFILLLQLY